MNSGFDKIAPLYDKLARLVYGRAIVDAQVCFLDRIPCGADILIVGGGTGWLLTEIQKGQPDCTVCYVEASSEMILRARARKSTLPVHFISGTHRDIPVKKYDVIVTNFFLDVFSDDELKEVLDLLKNRIQPHGLWFVSDFVDGSGWQKALLTIMYAFFKIVSGLGVNKLPAWKKSLSASGLKPIARLFFWRGFIESLVYIPQTS
jgi:tRNA (cmo5U34)-methyltransferase